MVNETTSPRQPVVECPVVVPVVCPEPQPASSDVKPVIGEVEAVRVEPPGLLLNARIDTGATTSSVNALDIERFERDGKRWVRFTLVDEHDKSYALERPVVRMVRIKRHAGEARQRAVVKLSLSLAGRTQSSEVSLTDRSDFDYKLLVGRGFLRDTFSVDISTKFTQSIPSKP
ncbi:MAG: RimK/LysX family protein [Motiliproteus sp.]